MTPDNLIILVVVLSSALGLYLCYSTYRYYRRRQRKLISHLKRTMMRRSEDGSKFASSSAFSLSGNLVKEHTTPIESYYELTNLLLGRGSSAEVVIGKNLKTLRRYAVKIIDSSRRDIAWRYEREMNILKDCDHTNIVRLFELYTSPGKRHFVMELCTGGHLGHALKQGKGRLDEETARQYILQIVHSIAHCHNRGICHRDVKLQNILLESNGADAQLKLIDFGNACRYVGNCPLTKIVGTTYTAAPEVFRESYDERCDIWSIGVVAYILLSGLRPFSSLDATQSIKARESSVVANILNSKFHFMHESWTGVNSAAIHFIKCCLEADYLKRRSAQGILNHPWLTHADLHSNIGLGISSIGARRLSRQLSRNLSSSELRRTSMIAVAFNMSSHKQQMHREIFQQINKTGSGVVDRKEFHACMRTANPNMSNEDIDVLFDTIDQDGNNAISFTEFVAATVDPKEVNIEELTAAFRLFDKDNKGYITKDDLVSVLSTSWCITNDNCGTEQDQDRQEKIDARVAAMFRSADVNSDGAIAYTEFLFAIADGSVNMQKNRSTQKKTEFCASRIESSRSGLSETVVTAQNTNASKEKQPAGDTAARMRRQSDSLLKLSRTSFRQRASSIINLRMGGVKPGASTSINANQGRVVATKSNTAAENRAPAVPSLLNFVISDIAGIMGIEYGLPLNGQGDMARRESNLQMLKPVENIEDSLSSSDSRDSSNDFDALRDLPSRRMSSPAMLWHNVKRRASMLIAPSSANSSGGAANAAGAAGGSDGDIEAGGKLPGQSESRQMRRSSVQKKRDRSLSEEQQQGQKQCQHQTEKQRQQNVDSAAGSIEAELPGSDGGKYAIDDGFDSMLLGTDGPKLEHEEVSQQYPEIGISDSPSSSANSSPVGVQRPKREGTLPRVDRHGPNSPVASALLAVSRNFSGNFDVDDDDGSDGNTSSASLCAISQKSDLAPSPRNANRKKGNAANVPTNRDSFMNAYGSASNSMDNENSFTNDSSASDADKLQELVHILRLQQQKQQGIMTDAKGFAMATIPESDDFLKNKAGNQFSLTSMLSTAFVAGMSVARGSVVSTTKVLTSGNQSAHDEEEQTVGNAINSKRRTSMS